MAATIAFAIQSGISPSLSKASVRASSSAKGPTGR
jgi:hypothetical protein